MAASTFLIQVFVPNSLEQATNSPIQNQPDQSADSGQFIEKVEFNENFYAIRYATIEEINKLQLFNNLSQLKSSQEVYQNNSCSHLINGSFYSENQLPIGWLLSEDNLESDYRQNQLFNGFLIVSDSNQALISEHTKDLSVARIGVQTGPVLISDFSERNLTLNQDKAARRSVALVTAEDKLIFATVTTSDNQYIGPFLKDLPQILQLFSKESNIKIKSAINLDGGSASAFITPHHRQLEITTVGSFFCQQTS
jgi:exopolysaccharide biosynthesis protein